MTRSASLAAALLALTAGCGQDRSAGASDAAADDAGARPDAPRAKDAAGPDARRDARPDDAARDARDAGSDAPAKPAPRVAYASGYGGSIAWFSVDETTGALAAGGSLPAFGASPSFLAVGPGAAHLYAVDESPSGRVGAYAIDPATGALAFQGAVSTGGSGPAFVSLDRAGRFVLVANYGDGSVSVLPVGTDGSLGAAVETLAVGAEAHMIVTDPSNRFAFVPCKGTDSVAQLVFDAAKGTLTPNAPPAVATAAGAGPRHLEFAPDGRHVYLINETNSTLGVYAFDAVKGTLSELQTVSTIPSTFTSPNTGAEVHVHPTGAWVFGSNRGHDSVVTFDVDAATGKLSSPRFTPSGGTTPRDFALDPGGALLYAANQGTGNVVPFRVDAKTGALAAVASPVSVAMASFVGVVALPGP